MEERNGHNEQPIDETTRLLGDNSNIGGSSCCEAQHDDSTTATATSSITSGWAGETWMIAQYSLPLMATYLLQYSITVVTAVAAGHLSSDDLAAASIGMTTMNIFGYSIYEGMATALDTLCSQSYGSGNKTAVGLHVQRMLLLMAAATVPVAALWICSPWLLGLVVRQPHLAVKAGSFLRVSLAGIPGYASFEALKRFLQAQGDFRSALVVLIICAPVNAFLAWLFAFRLGMGLEGAALGGALSNDLRPVLMLGYIVLWGQWSHGCWGGFTRRALADLWPAARLALAGTMVNLGEWATFEILVFSTSYLSVDHLAAMTVLTTTSVVIWHVPFSVAVAVSTRVGHMIGSGRVTLARRTTPLYALMFVGVGFFNAGFVYVFRNLIPNLYSDDPDVQALAARTTLTMGAFLLMDAVMCGCNGMLRGLGRQAFAAWVVIIINYPLTVPWAIWLELGSPHLGLDGVWIGVGSGMVLVAAIEVFYMKTIRWQDCVESVKQREGSYIE